MSQALILYTEPLNIDEISFLERKVERDRSQYYKVFRLLMVLSFIIPFAGAWYRAMDDAPNAFSPIRFFAGVIVLLSISSVGTYLAYRAGLKKIQHDLHQRTKTIEVSHIMRKQFMPQNNSYFFYIDSPTKLSIEVSHHDFHRMSVGDEVNIEYTTYGKLYLGYF